MNMDLYCSDTKLSELTDGPLGDFLDSDVFTPPVSTPMDHGFGLDSASGSGSVMDSEWLDNFFDPVLNDRMISDALQPAPGQQSSGGGGGVQSEHSYSSLHNHHRHHDDDDDDEDDRTLDLSNKSHNGNCTTDVKDLDMELTAVNPNNMTLSTAHTTIPTASSHGLRFSSSSATSPSDMYIKQEPLDLSLDTEMTTVTVTRSTNPQTLLKQPTIILATTSSGSASQQQQQHHLNGATTTTLRQVLPKVEIKMEQPQQQQQQQQHHHQQHHQLQQQQQQQQQQRYTTTTTHSLISSPEHSTESFDSLSLPPTPPSSTNSDSDGSGDRSPPCSPLRSSRHRPASPLIQQPFFMSPIPTSGVLMLTEEEKRTLISEGYPIPGKLPLTKQEEKNLKKIRRKIKNKISAQESRRKKKEYVETLERKVEAYSQENVDLRKKMDNLQNNNQSLMSQLHKLQAIVRNYRPLSPGGAQSAGTCLMVLVLCFAVSLGAWSPMSLSMGYSSSVSSLAAVTGPGSIASSSYSSSSSSSSSPAYYLSSSGGGSGQQFSPSPDMLAAAVGGRGGGGGGGGVGREVTLQASTVHQGLAAAGQEAEQQGEPQAIKDPSSATYGPYATPNMRSRVLLSVEEEEGNTEEFGPHAPFSYKWLLGGIFGGSGCSADHAAVATGQSHQPTLPKVNSVDVDVVVKQMGSASRQPDIAVTTSSKPINATA